MDLTSALPRNAARRGGYERVVRHAAVVRELGADYAGARADLAPPVAGEPPFGKPVLAEVPALAQVLTTVHAADQLLVRAVLAMADLLRSDDVASITGVDVDHWLAATARTTRLDRSLLRRMCRLLDRLPSLREAAADGGLSFAQLRALTLGLHGAPRLVDPALDAWLAAALDQLPEDADPDVIVRQASKALDELVPELLDQQDEDVARHTRGLRIQPNLFGTGGSYHGTEDALGLAVLEAATAPRHDQLDQDLGQARADNLQAHLRHACNDSDTRGDESEDGRQDSDRDGHADGEHPGGLAPPKLVLRWDLDALLDVTSTPASILTRLVGGRLRLTSSAARRLIDERGADVRSIIVDQGEVVGVGRATRIPTGWLRDAVLAVHDTCTGPMCDRPALGAHLDHAQPWAPIDPHRAGGRTDVDNLGPLCASTNRDKEAAGWRATQTRRGTRTWHHPRSGLTITSVPGTWRPAGVAPPRHHRGGAPPPERTGSDPPTGGSPATDLTADGGGPDDALPF